MESGKFKKSDVFSAKCLGKKDKEVREYYKSNYENIVDGNNSIAKSLLHDESG